jgi:hypothetical protein
MKHLLLVIVTLLLLVPRDYAAAQVNGGTGSSEISAPLELVRAWSRVAGLDDLRDRAPEDDVELRFWYGPIVQPSEGFILSHRDGVWSFALIEITSHGVALTVEQARREGLLPPCVLDEMTAWCGAREIDPATDYGSGTMPRVILECPQIYIPDGLEASNFQQLWANLVVAGLLELPSSSEAPFLPDADHGYVIEGRAEGRYFSTVLLQNALEGVNQARLSRVINIIEARFGLPVSRSNGW